MNVKIYKRGMRISRIAFCLVAAMIFVGIANAQEKIGKQQQGLISDEVVDSARQEKYGLVTLSTACSGSLLRNTWVITAAHCVEIPDPADASREILVPENSVTLTATWKSSTQTRQSVRIISLRPNDVAIIRVAEPFTGTYANNGYNPGVYQGSLKPMNIMAFGRGVNQFAQGAGASAMPSQTDGLFRAGYFNTDVAGDATYSFPTGNQTIAGGDSGGPSYVQTSAGDLLVGVHSSCQVICMLGKTCVKPSVWRWAVGTPRCTDASVAPVWDEINRYLGAFVPPRVTGTLPGPNKVLGRTRVPGTPASTLSICESAQLARARNSPAAPGLEAQCRAAGGDSSVKAPPIDVTQLNDLAVKGEAIANADPLTAELRNQQPDDPSRRGFDIGMAAAEGQTAPGPGKDRIRDSLSPDERGGFTTAVTFSLERNRNADLAAKGAAIAEADPSVAEARIIEADVFYWLGFDIATGIFGDPALGALGNTATGPGSLKIRDSLSAAGQRGFDAAVTLHLSRNYRR